MCNEHFTMRGIYLRSVFVAVMACVASSLSQVKAQSADGAFSIRGVVDGGANGDTVILAKVSGRNLMPVDTAVYHNGAFEFKGQTDGAHLLFLLGVKEGRPAFGSDVIVEPGSLWVRLFKDPERTAEVPKSVSNSLWRSFSQHDNEIMSQMRPYVEASRRGNLSIADQALCKNAIDSLGAERARNVSSFVKAHPTSLVADLVFSMYYTALPDADFAALSALLAKNNPQLPGYVATMANIENERVQKQAKNGVFIDFSLPDRDGKMVKVSDVVKANKVTLIDFWASWCGPCRAEMPTVKRAYDFFKRKGLEVVGVSLDSNRESWLKAVDALGLNWIHISDLKGWQCSAAQTYGVHSIPSSVLVDSEGRVIAKDLRGEQLIQVLLRVLN